jgi:hypothetical protein
MFIAAQQQARLLHNRAARTQNSNKKDAGFALAAGVRQVCPLSDRVHLRGIRRL